MGLNFLFRRPIENGFMPMRPLPFVFRHRPAAPTVESLHERLRRLTSERQELRATGAAAVVLEQNRMAIAGTQWELAYALIERYVPQPEAARSAA
jgi:hypothetical protein